MIMPPMVFLSSRAPLRYTRGYDFAKLQNTPLGMEPAIHVPRALYRAATGDSMVCVLEYGRDVDQSSPETSAVNVDFPEYSRFKVDSQALLFEAHGYRTSRPKLSESSTICGLVDLLHRIGRCLVPTGGCQGNLRSN